MGKPVKRVESESCVSFGFDLSCWMVGVSWDGVRRCIWFCFLPFRFRIQLKSPEAEE